MGDWADNDVAALVDELVAVRRELSTVRAAVEELRAGWDDMKGDSPIDGEMEGVRRLYDAVEALLDLPQTEDPTDTRLLDRMLAVSTDPCSSCGSTKQACDLLATIGDGGPCCDDCPHRKTESNRLFPFQLACTEIVSVLGEEAPQALNNLPYVVQEVVSERNFLRASVAGTAIALESVLEGEDVYFPATLVLRRVAKVLRERLRGAANDHLLAEWTTDVAPDRTEPTWLPTEESP